MSPRAKLALILGGAVVLAAAIVAAALIAAPPEAPPESAPPAPLAAPAAPRKAAPAAPPAAPPAFIPAPAAAPKAVPREEADRALEAVKRESERLAAGGDAVAALAALKRAGADAEAAAFENRLRAGFNETALRAKDLAAAGKEREAAALFDARSKGTLPGIAARCAEAAAALRAVAERKRTHAAGAELEAARAALRDELKAVLPAELRARRWPEALARIDAAMADPRWKGLKAELSDERSFLALGAAFRDAFVQALQDRLNQDASLLLAGGARARGRLTAVAADRVVLRTAAEDEVDLPFDQISADQVAAWTLDRRLPPEDGLTWLKAAVFFFGEGRDDLAALYLATAREKSAEIDAVERLWREGLLRQLITK